jgi:hypothetical protein
MRTDGANRLTLTHEVFYCFNITFISQRVIIFPKYPHDL